MLDLKELQKPTDVAQKVLSLLPKKSSFETWCLKIHTCWKVAFYSTSRQKGDVLLYGDPSLVHESTIESLKSRIQSQVHDVLRGHHLYFDEVVYLLGAASHNLPNGIVKQPDAAYTSVGAKPPLKPRMTLEVAYKNENLERLIEEVKLWNSWDIKYSAGIKIEVKVTGTRENKADDIKMFWVQQYEVEREPTVLEFGPGICKEPNLPRFQVRFLLSCLIEVNPSLDTFICFDLFQVQQKIWNVIADEAEDNAHGG
ncbi:hypothetical protein GOP47_0007800 [Adiantum capillus-veneris]|uniref:Uncharacterized protein n=1 Tax=Adiantum capillus-veneris TaxID=13818 RepID=A0A9D4V227_ADICA|nr:hypothetical protein GOP47_0007800 [Adiantum capillus-veneris]